MKYFLVAIASLGMVQMPSALRAQSAPATAAAGDAALPVTTHHSVSTGRGSLGYDATAGTLTLRDDAGRPRAAMFYVAYTVPRRPNTPERPVTFFFNGGPGSSSMWLHVGSFGPVRVSVDPPGSAMTAPYRLVPNERTLLDKSDLVFLDAIGTGYSRAFDPADNKFYWGNDQDTAAFVQAISRYLTLNDRWNAPKFLFGESYGTMRAAMLASKLHTRGIDLAGIVLMSTILNFGHMAPGLDQATIDLLPSYAVTAAYHQRISPVPGGTAELAREAREFARGPYAIALAKGDLIPDAERDAVALRLHDLTGLPFEYLKGSDLRIGIDQFRRELLRDRRQSIGALDTRYVGAEANGNGERSSFDPTEAAVAAAYTSAFNGYVTGALHYRTTQDYIVGNGRQIMGQWDWSHQPAEGDRQNSLADAVPDLAVAMRQEPQLKILALNGWYDVMTPFFGAEFDLARLSLGKNTADRVRLRYYPSGHMIYLEPSVLPALRDDVAGFYDEVLDVRPRAVQTSTSSRSIR